MRCARPPQSMQMISASGTKSLFIALSVPRVEQSVLRLNASGRSLSAMRVISGEFGGRKLVAPEGLDTRPTTDKVRQAVFNSLTSMGVLEGAVVCDLYAGSGSMGIEALSRGAQTCTFVERDRNALAALRDNIRSLKIDDRCTVVGTDVIAFAPGITGVDIALVDPPYSFANWPKILGSLRAGIVVAESDREVEPQLGWDATKVKRYGRTVITILERVP